MVKVKSQAIEREYIINLRKDILITPKYKRAPKAVKAIKKFIVKHMRIPERDVKKVKLDKWLNNELWFRGIQRPPTKIKVRAKKDGEFVRVELAEIPEIIKYKIAREEKSKKESEKKAEKLKEEKKEIKKEDLERKTEEKKEELKEETEKLQSASETKEKMAELQYKQQKHVKKEISPKAQHRMALQK